MNKTEAYRIVLADMLNYPLFCGLFDYHPESTTQMHYIYGIETVMEWIAEQVSDSAYSSIEEMFSNNIRISKLKKGVDTK